MTSIGCNRICQNTQKHSNIFAGARARAGARAAVVGVVAVDDPNDHPGGQDDAGAIQGVASGLLQGLGLVKRSKG